MRVRKDDAARRLRLRLAKETDPAGKVIVIPAEPANSQRVVVPFVVVEHQPVRTSRERIGILVFDPAAA